MNRESLYISYKGPPEYFVSKKHGLLLSLRTSRAWVWSGYIMTRAMTERRTEMIIYIWSCDRIKGTCVGGWGWEGLLKGHYCTFSQKGHPPPPSSPPSVLGNLVRGPSCPSLRSPHCINADRLKGQCTPKSSIFILEYSAICPSRFALFFSLGDMGHGVTDICILDRWPLYIHTI